MNNNKEQHVAMFKRKMRDGTIKCTLCPHGCSIANNAFGFCMVRKNSGGVLNALGYGKISSIALDPIEKKPFYRFHPGKMVLSIGGFGCNFKCPFCQNCEISTEYRERWEHAEFFSPKDIVTLAKKSIPAGNIGVAYTYNEPMIGYEFVYDTAKLVHDAGLINILVTNGYIKIQPLKKLLPYIDAMNIDLKAFTEEFYKRLGGDLESVKRTIKLAHEYCHIEITTMIVPGENDSKEEMRKLAQWLSSIDDKIPLHLIRFYPHYKYANKSPTPPEIIDKLGKIARKYLKNVFTR